MGKANLAASLAVSIGLAVAGAAEASSGARTCAREADVRTIEVLTPGIVGAACDLRYVRDGGTNISVPYHADNSAEFCAERARSLIRSLQDEGYECLAAAPANAPPELRTDTTIDDGAVDVAAALERAEPAEAAADPIAAPAEAVSAPSVAEALEQFLPPGDPARIESASLPATANHGPAALSVSNASFPARVERRSGSAVGRITGAEPAAPVEPAPAADPAAPAGGETTQTPATAATALSSIKSAQARPRPAEDVIRAVLLAQTAAWNDGDLGAFMTGYWKSDEFRFISGTSVSKGWTQTLERYQERYGADLGRLSFEGLDVEMIGEDIAIVSGRYSLARAGEADLGALSLVMKRFDGLWRIVHEHLTADGAPGEKVESGFSQDRRDH